MLRESVCDMRDSLTVDGVRRAAPSDADEGSAATTACDSPVSDRILLPSQKRVSESGGDDRTLDQRTQ